ncbi:MAG: D-Ala-D-Ala carboxypeptidase family metallohydrolase, partial [Nodosilinea sp.]
KTFRQPDNRGQVEQIIKMARVMQQVRRKLGNRRITITSWLRPYAVNLAVGGASNSRHLYGDGVDFTVTGMSPAQVYGALDSWWGTQGGLAQGGRLGFTHLDGRGQMARWEYLGA